MAHQLAWGVEIQEFRKARVFSGVALFLVYGSLGALVACSDKEPDFKYRWIGGDQWAAEHGCNVNIPAEYQNKKYDYYRIWGGFHTFESLLPSKKMFAHHPEYYALRDGDRIPSQLCTSNPEVQRLVADKIREILRQDPQIHAIILGPNDNRLFCQCPRCEVLDEPDPTPDAIYSRRLFLFYRSISALVHAEFPDVIILFGAYDLYAGPPKDKSLILPPKTFPLICHFQQYCNNHPIRDPSCGPNARFREVISGWQRRAPDLFIYEYYYKQNWLDLPWPIVHAVKTDIAWFREHGVKGFYSQYHPDSAGSLLNAYVAASLLLNDETDVDRLVETFCREKFGPAWEEMQAYFVILEDAMMASGRHIPSRGFALPHAPHVFTDQVMDRCDELLTGAMAKTAHTSYGENVLRFVKLMSYTKRCVDFLQRANEVLNDDEKGGGRTGGKETAEEALHKGESVMAFLKQNEKEFEGVMPSPGVVNPYMQIVLDQLISY